MPDETPVSSPEVPEADKIALTNEDEFLKDFPSEDGEPKEEIPPSPKEGEEKVDKSEVAQKVHWREKYFKAKEELDKLNYPQPDANRESSDAGVDDKEKAAREYIRKLAREEADAAYKEREAQETKVFEEFQDRLNQTLEDNPDITEADLLNTIEEFEVQPEVAVRIMKRSQEARVPKPRMPAPRRSSPSPSAPVTKPDDSQKSMWQIAQEEVRKFYQSKK